MQEAWFPRWSGRATASSGLPTLMSQGQGHQKVPAHPHGRGDLIKEILSHFEVLHDNVRIIPNFLDFDSSSAVRGSSAALHPCFTKKASSQEGEDRKNVILIGDSLWGPQDGRRD